MSAHVACQLRHIDAVAIRQRGQLPQLDVIDLARIGEAMPFTLQMVNKVRPTPAALHIAWKTLTFAGAP